MDKNFQKRLFIFFVVGILFLAQNLFTQIEQFYESWRWAHFTTNSGLPSDIVESVIEADDNTVWVSTAKGIAWYDGYRWNSMIIDSLIPRQRVRSMTKYFKGKIFVILSGTLYIGDRNGFSKVVFSNISNQGLISSACSLDSTSYLCIYENADSISMLKVKGNNAEWFRSPTAGKLYKPKTSIWFASTEIGLCKLNINVWDNVIPQTVALRDVVENTLGESVFAVDAPKHRIGIWEYKNKNNCFYSITERNQPVRTLDISNSNEITVVYESGEVHIKNEGIWKNIDPLPRQMININAIKYRDNNDLWVATENGLYLFKRQINEWTKNSYPFSDLKNVVMEIYKTNSGDIWIGNLNGIEIRKKNGKKKFITQINNHPLGLVTGINQDVNNHIWISSGGGTKGIFEWDGKIWRHHFKDKINFHKIRKDYSGRLWFLGLGSKATDLAGYILQDQRFLKIDSIYHLPSNRIYSFAEHCSGTIWLGTSEGLVRIKNGAIKFWGHESFGANAKIYTIAIDNDEKIWFSTFSAHLGTISQNDSIVWIWKQEEIYEYNQKVWDLSFDEFGVLWVATTRGLYTYYNSIWSNYNNVSGAFFRELRVILPTADKIFIGGHGIGLRTIDRKKIGINIKIVVSPPIVEEDAVHCSWEANSYWNLIPSEQIETRYKLNDDQWSTWSTQHSATFHYLPSGNYRLAVQANDSYGYIYESNKEARFFVEPPILFRPIFLIPLLILSCISIILTIRYYKNQKLHKLIIQNQRIRIANDLHDEVGSNLGSIALMSQRIGRNKSIPSNAKEELSIISETAIQTADFLRDIVWYINPRNDNLINMQTRLKEIAARMLKNVDLQFHINDSVGNDRNLTEIRRNILLMFKEILHNIVKHSHATKVDINFDRKIDSFLLIVRDNGIGFDQHSEHYGYGMQSIKKRAEEIGALLEIKSRKGEGTVISIVFKNNINT